MGNTTTERAGHLPAERAASDRRFEDHMYNAGPGWYYDPDDEAVYRYWDGHRWTEHRSDTVLTSVPGRSA